MNKIKILHIEDSANYIKTFVDILQPIDNTTYELSYPNPDLNNTYLYDYLDETGSYLSEDYRSFIRKLIESLRVSKEGKREIIRILSMYDIIVIDINIYQTQIGYTEESDSYFIENSEGLRIFSFGSEDLRLLKKTDVHTIALTITPKEIESSDIVDQIISKDSENVNEIIYASITKIINHSLKNRKEREMANQTSFESKGSSPKENHQRQTSRKNKINFSEESLLGKFSQFMVEAILGDRDNSNLRRSNDD